jgi:butyryl-CoA dehydrogenase
MGLFGSRIPEEYGGLGLDTVTYARLIEELAAGWMSLTGVVNTHTIAASLLVKHGTDEQKSQWLPRMATGEMRGALSLSEPDAGSDTSAIRCRAVRDGDEYVINGTKMWVTNGERASIVALAARTDEGITCFIVEKDPGASFGGIATSKRIGKLGYKGLETVEMTYTDHRVPAAWVLGGDAGLGKGQHWILSGLELGRVNIATPRERCSSSIASAICGGRPRTRSARMPETRSSCSSARSRRSSTCSGRSRAGDERTISTAPYATATLLSMA